MAERVIKQDFYLRLQNTEELATFPGMSLMFDVNEENC